MIKNIISLTILIISINLCSAQEQNTIAKENFNFSYAIFKNSYKSNSNFLICPISIKIALAMTYEGAKGSTAKEFIKVFGFNKDIIKHHKYYIENLKTLNEDNNSQLSIANALMAQQDYPFSDLYFKSMEEYGAYLQYANFVNEIERDAARRNLNNWISEKTNKKIIDLIKKDSFDALTRLIIVNAVYFNAKWALEFDKNKTRQMVFYAPEKQSIAHYMQGRSKYNYYQDSTLQALELPYEGNRFSLISIMPVKEINLNDFINNFTYEKYDSITKGFIEQEVDIQYPLFTVNSDIKMKEIFKKMGIINAFTAKANFKNITGRKDLYIDEILHQTFIKVDEMGTEASGSTAVIMRQKNAPLNQYVYFHANRPFLYFIKDNKSENILFIGCIFKPIKD